MGLHDHDVGNDLAQGPPSYCLRPKVVGLSHRVKIHKIDRHLIILEIAAIWR